MIPLRWLIASLVTIPLTVQSFAASPANSAVITHAQFFSSETEQSQVVDPHVFVQDATMPEAVGLLGIKHAAGLRPALVERDAARSTLYTADGKALGMNLGEWLHGTFSLTMTHSPADTRLDASFSGLKPRGYYSLFERRSDQTRVVFIPIDGTGKSNSFAAGADGSAKLSISLARPLPATSAVVLIYHSDNQAHGLERGRIGFDAHHLVMTRPK